MAFDGYFSFGGNEIVNNERAAGYSRSAECPLPQLRSSCDAIPDVLGDGGYNAQQMESAPWFDSAVPESSRFYGLYALEVKDMNTSTRSVALAEGIDDGGVLGRARKGPKAVRVKAMLVAQGQDALEYGHAWLNSALDPNACGQHGAGCGTSDIRFFSSCPPSRAMIPYYTDWALQQTNLLTNPDMETAGSAVVVRTNANPSPRMYPTAAGWATTPAVATITGTAAGTQIDITAITSAPILFNSADMAIASGDRWTGSIEVTVPAGFPAMPLRLDIYSYGQNAAIGTSGTVTVQPGTTVTVSAPSTIAASAATTGVRMIVYGAGGPVGGRAIFRNALAEKALTPGPYFDGGSQPILRTNLHPNPAPASSAGYLAVNGATAAYDSASILVTCSPGSADSGVRVHTIPVQSGTPLTISAEIQAVNAGTWRINVQLSGRPVQQVSLPAFAAGETRRVSFTYNPSAAGTAAVYVLRSDLSGSEIARIRKVQLEAVQAATPYFDGASSKPGYGYAWTGGANVTPSIEWDADFSTRWQGTANASASELTGVGVVGVGSTGGVAAIQSSRWVKAGAKSLRLIPTSTSSNVSYVAFTLPGSVSAGGTIVVTSYQEGSITGSTWSMLGKLYTNPASTTYLTPQRPNAAGAWEHRLNFGAGQDNFILTHGGLAGSGDVWYDLALLTATLNYAGPAFSGASAPADPTLQRYRWTGAADASTSVYETRELRDRPQTDDEYAADWTPTVRYLHDVATTSGPIERDLMNSGDWWAQVVEWTWTSERPWIYGEPKKVDLPTTPSFVVEDVRYNRVPYPSMELAGAADVPMLYNLSTNPSVETNATDWNARTVSTPGVPAGQFTGARSTELAAQGGASYRIQVLGNATAVAARPDSVDAFQDIPLMAAARTRYSINIWAALIKIAGNANNTLTNAQAIIDWRNAGSSLRVDTIGTATGAQLNGFVFQQRSILPPAGATIARVIVRGAFTWEPGNATAGDRADIRLYADALALSVP